MRADACRVLYPTVPLDAWSRHVGGSACLSAAGRACQSAMCAADRSWPLSYRLSHPERPLIASVWTRS